MTGIRFDEHLDTLRRELINAINPALQRFQDRTGVMPKNIRVIMLDASTQVRPRVYVLGDVRLEFEL